MPEASRRLLAARASCCEKEDLPEPPVFYYHSPGPEVRCAGAPLGPSLLPSLAFLRVLRSLPCPLSALRSFPRLPCLPSPRPLGFICCPACPREASVLRQGRLCPRLGACRGDAWGRPSRGRWLVGRGGVGGKAASEGGLVGLARAGPGRGWAGLGWDAAAAAAAAGPCGGRKPRPRLFSHH